MQGGSRRPSVARSGHRRHSDRGPAILPVKDVEAAAFSRTSPGSRRSFTTGSSRNASRPSVWSSRRSRPETSPTFYEPVRPILFAIHDTDSVIDADLQQNDSHVPLSGTVGQPFAQPSGTVSPQVIRLFRRRVPVSEHLPQPELIRGSSGRRGEINTRDNGQPAGCPLSFQTWHNMAARALHQPIEQNGDALRPNDVRPS